jgi:DNA polymerase I
MIYFISKTQSLWNAPEQGVEIKTCTIQDVVNYCKTKDILGVDTETEGLDFTKHSMILFQIGDEENQYLIDTRNTDIEPLRGILESKSILKVLQNAKFDYKMILQKTGIKLENIYDTMLVEKVIHCGKFGLSYSLKALCAKYLAIELDKGISTSFTELHGRPFTYSQLKYAADDIEPLLSIRTLQLLQVENLDLETTIDLENKAILAFSDMEFNGMPLNTMKWKILALKAKTEAELLRAKLDFNLLHNRLLKDKYKLPYIQGELFTDTALIRKTAVNWASPTQVLGIFRCLVPELETVNANELVPYAKMFIIIEQYIEYKEKMKLATSYGDKFLDHIRNTGNIHTSFNPILNTGRSASALPNMQQIPADNAYRNCFEDVDDPESVFVSGDYASQELCIIAFGSQDPVWLKALNAGEDLHSVCASLVYGISWGQAAEVSCAYLVDKSKCDCPEHKTLRTNVKTINFGLAYGMGPNKLADNLGISLNEAKGLIQDYFKAFPAIKAFLEALGNYGKNNGTTRTFFPYRRLRSFDGWYNGIQNLRYKDNKTSELLGIIERASKNTPIQGTGADMTKYAMVLVREEIQNYDLPVKLVMAVHDQIDTITTRAYAPEWKIRLQKLMERAALRSIPSGELKADVDISKQWKK